ncbi:unnamed protein product [Prorocentrum cordatum]|uniref:Uncharacterized protein n=1 Tax=Prorocentrum cordatum TaxID=2364126 RepID=A0ABN9W6K2_9DINO|nr:unnamed protein product [Polarella glacialis]
MAEVLPAGVDPQVDFAEDGAVVVPAPPLNPASTLAPPVAAPGAEEAPPTDGVAESGAAELMAEVARLRAENAQLQLAAGSSPGEAADARSAAPLPRVTVGSEVEAKYGQEFHDAVIVEVGESYVTVKWAYDQSETEVPMEGVRPRGGAMLAGAGVRAPVTPPELHRTSGAIGDGSASEQRWSDEQRWGHGDAWEWKAVDGAERAHHGWERSPGYWASSASSSGGSGEVVPSSHGRAASSGWSANVQGDTERGWGNPGSGAAAVGDSSEAEHWGEWRAASQGWAWNEGDNAQWQEGWSWKRRRMSPSESDLRSTSSVASTRLSTAWPTT